MPYLGSHRCPIWGPIGVPLVPYLGSHWGPYLGSLFGVPSMPYLRSLFGVPLGSLFRVPLVPYLRSLFGVPLVLYLRSHWGPIGVPIWGPYLRSHWGPIGALFEVPIWGPYLGSLCGVPIWGPIGVPSVPYLGSHRCPIWGPIGVPIWGPYLGPIGVPPSAFISGLLPRRLWGFLGSLWDPDARLHTAALPPSTGIIPPSATSTPRGRISACASAMGCGTGT